MSNKIVMSFALGLALPLWHTAARAYDVNDKLSIGGVLATTVQCQELSDAPGFSNTCETSAPLQPEFSFRPTEAEN